MEELVDWMGNVSIRWEDPTYAATCNTHLAPQIREIVDFDSHESWYWSASSGRTL